MISRVLPVMLLLAGCVVDPVKPLVLPWPTNMQECTVNSLVVNADSTITISYEDNINIAICDRDMIRYINDLTSMICTHQPEDTRCKQRKN